MLASMTTRSLPILLSITATLTAGPLQNADFESALGNEWRVKNSIPNGTSTSPTPPFARVSGTRPNGNGNVSGAWVLETGGRDHVEDGPLQGTVAGDPTTATLKNTLTSASYGNDRTYTTRVWVKLDASAVEATFRCLLRWRDNGVAQIPLILAESVILQPGVWIEATSTVTLHWNTSLTAATIDFEVEQLHKGGSLTPPPQWFPSFQIDDLQMELDGDGDGLWDSEESANHSQTTISFSDNPDSDGDRMTDDWELAQIPPLNPRDASDGPLDPDVDGFTNMQEYFAATNPHDTNQFPGNPCDPQSTFLTRALLRYLALRPSASNTLSGQMVSDNSTEYDTYVAALATQTGRWPALLGVAVEGGTTSLDVVASMDHAISFTNGGGIAQLKWAMWNPWRAHLYVLYQQIGTPGDLLKIDIPGILDPAGTPTIAANTAQENLDARAVMTGWIDTVAAEILRYNAATGSQPLLFRPLSEMNGGWFWWGHRTRAEYLGLWNFIYDRLVNHHGIHNLIWVYESAQSEHVHTTPTGLAAASDYYYPGDDRVDVMAHNLYDDDWILPFDANKIYSRYPKIYGVPQAGPGKDQPDSRDGHFDNMTYITQIALRYPRMSFFIVWNSFFTNGGATHHKIAITDSTNPSSLMSDTRVVTRDELAWHPATALAASTLSSTQAALTWLPPPGDTGTRVEQSADGVTGWITVASTAPATAMHTATGLAPASATWFRVRALHGADDSLPTDPMNILTWSLFQQWKNDTLGNFAAPDHGDDDHDGMNTLLEYILGASPLSDSSAQLPTQGIVNVSNEDYLALTFRRLTGSHGATMIVEANDSLLPGNWMPTPVSFSQPVDNGDGTETITFRDTVPIRSAPKRFMRLRVTIP
jgi:Glycosyl hydrolase family 26